MKSRVLLVVLLVCFCAVPHLRAQCQAADPQSPGCLADRFPDLQVLEADLMENETSMTPTEVMKASGPSVESNASAPHLGRWADLDAILWDNLKFQAQATYTDTLQRSTLPGGDELAPFKLTGVELIPSYSLTYSLTLGDLTKAHRHWLAAQQVRQRQKTLADADLQKLRDAYVKFETLRAQFLDAQDKGQGVRTAFYQMKAQAVDVLALAHSPMRLVDTRLQAEYTTQPTAPGPVQAGAVGK